MSPVLVAELARLQKDNVRSLQALALWAEKVSKPEFHWDLADFFGKFDSPPQRAGEAAVGGNGGLPK